jgi:chromosome segregation protein
MQGWLESHRLDKAPRLWQDIEIEAGWEDALEAGAAGAAEQYRAR